MKQEVLGTVQGIAGALAEEWKMAEPAGEDNRADTTVDTGTADDLSRFGRFIGPSALPGDRDALRRSAETLEAPDDVLADLDSVPAGVTCRTVAEIWAALGRGAARRAPQTGAAG